MFKVEAEFEGDVPALKKGTRDRPSPTWDDRLLSSSFLPTPWSLWLKSDRGMLPVESLARHSFISILLAIDPCVIGEALMKKLASHAHMWIKMILSCPILTKKRHLLSMTHPRLCGGLWFGSWHEVGLQLLPLRTRAITRHWVTYSTFASANAQAGGFFWVPILVAVWS